MPGATGKAVLVDGLDVATDRFEGPVIEWTTDKDWLVTRHAEDQDELTPEAKRKREQREREKAVGVGEIRLQFSLAERAELDEARAGRGSQGEPYTTTEYIKTLIRNDVARLRNERARLDGRICKNCQKPLPRGCGGTWGNEALCLLARSEIALAL